MKIEKMDGQSERSILTGMIVDSSALGKIAPIWKKEGLFQSRWVNLCAEWCVDYYNRYGKAPRKDIEGLFRSWASQSQDKEMVAPLEDFLSELSDEYARTAKQLNSEYLVDQASLYFEKVKIQSLAEMLTGHVDKGKVKEARQLIASYSEIQLGTGTVINVLEDMTAIASAFKSRSKPIITYPGALGNFFGGALERDGFIAFMGPRKRGKTWWLLDMAWRGLMQGLKVIFFEVGDLSQDQIMRRYMIRCARRPLEAKTIKYPSWIERGTDQESMATVEWEEITFKTALNEEIARKAAVKTAEKYGQDQLRLSCHPNRSISIIGINDILKELQRKEDWHPDLVIIDYADILAPMYRTKEPREAINETWMEMRSLSQRYHCLVVTATQSNRESFKAHRTGREHLSDDRRKFDHVTGGIAISMSDIEKRQLITRLSWTDLREWEFSEEVECHVAGCLDIANPAVKSTF